MSEGNINHIMLDGASLRQQLEKELPTSRESIKFISAYITQNAIDWFCQYAPQDTTVYILCRLLPSDIASGASQLSALRTALEHNYKVYCLHSLHAKIYSIDDKIIYVGSANLTTNGLKIYGRGNLEASIQIEPTIGNLNFIANILASATVLNTEILQKMQAYIEQKSTEGDDDVWPENILLEDEGIWVRDFFWQPPGLNGDDEEVEHDLRLLGFTSIMTDISLLKNRVANARCIKWLTRVLQNSENNEMFFGSLTQCLHDALKDDPTPYRRDVKTLIQNMLLYCDLYMKDKIEITRPNYSQKIKLIKAYNERVVS